jgi:hypothetical protein
MVDGTGEDVGVETGVGAGIGVAVGRGVEGVCVDDFCVVDGCCARAFMPSANTYTITRKAHLRCSPSAQSDVKAIRFLKPIT